MGKIYGEGAIHSFLYPATPGSEKDEHALRNIRMIFDTLPLVQQLRKDPDYLESGVYESFSEEKKPHRLTSGPMAGSRGLGLQVGLSIPKCASTSLHATRGVLC